MPAINRKHIGIFLIIFLLVWEPVKATSRYWVFFKDKGVTAVDAQKQLQHIRAGYPEKSFARRQKSGIGFDLRDLPIHQEYIDSIVSTGGVICQKSRWVNAISIEADDSIFAKIDSYDFITGVQLVRGLEVSRYGLIETEGLTSSTDNELHSPANPYISRGAYGPSFRQAELAGVIDAHDRGLTGAGVLLGMLDTGFQLDHRAFAGLEVIGQYDFIFNDPDPSYDPRTDRPGQANHGTGCLSVIVGYDPGFLVGIAPCASVALAKTEVTGSETQIEEDYWIAGIEWLEWLGADVISSSLSYKAWYSRNDLDGLTPLVTRAAQRACELGMVLCNSAGNAGSRIVSIGAPADAQSVLAIAAVDSNRQLTGFSSRGPSADGRVKPDVAAMGHKVVCVKPLTRRGYSRWNGTSLSCPIVAGVVALVIEAHPDWSSRKVVEAIRETSDRAYRPDFAIGYGIVSAVDAIDYPSLFGKVVSFSDGKPIPGVEISLSFKDWSGTITSDITGRYSFVNLPEGVYSLTAALEGEVITTRENLIIPPSMPMDLVIE